jgi:hypothetical protein
MVHTILHSRHSTKHEVEDSKKTQYEEVDVMNEAFPSQRHIHAEVHDENLFLDNYDKTFVWQLAPPKRGSYQREASSDNH